MTQVIITGEGYWVRTGWNEDTFKGLCCKVRLKVSEEYKDACLRKEPMLKNKFKFDEVGNRIDGGGWYFEAMQTKKDDWKDGDNAEVVFMDQNKKPWDTSILIGNGSLMKVGVEVYQAKRAPAPSVKLRQVMVTDLVEYGGGGGDDTPVEFDFDDELV